MKLVQVSSLVPFIVLRESLSTAPWSQLKYNNPRPNNGLGRVPRVVLLYLNDVGKKFKVS
ncbi:hypothetical protein GCM10009122_14300 [Fulvivirga kasyanovii]